MQKIDANYLVYVTNIPRIMLINKTGLKIMQFYLEGFSQEQIVRQLSQEYTNCDEERLVKDVDGFLKQIYMTL